LSAIGVVAVTVWLSACDGPADHARTTLTQLAAVKVLSETPPGGIILGKGKDEGSSSSITGREPSLTTVFAVAGTVADTAAYYQNTYPQYRFSENCCTSPDHEQLFGQSAWARILINIVAGPPVITAADHYNVKLATAPTDHPTSVSINVSGQAPNQS